MVRTLDESDDDSDAGVEGASLPGTFAAPTFTQQYDPETKVSAPADLPLLYLLRHQIELGETRGAAPVGRDLPCPSEGRGGGMT